MAAPQVPTLGSTPAQGNPYPAPGEGEDTRRLEGVEGERGLGVRCCSLSEHKRDVANKKDIE